MIKEIKVKKDAKGNDNLSKTKRNEIRGADAKAEKLIGKVWKEIDKIYEKKGKDKDKKRKDAWLKNERFKTWLGEEKVTNEEIKDVRRRVKKIKDKIEKGIKYVVIKEQTGKNSHGCDSKTDAYVWGPIHGKKIYLCPGWFQKYGRMERASILIHEIVHKLGLFGQGHHKAESYDEAKRLAKNNPKKARKSPENYRYLALSYQTEINYRIG